MAVQTMRLVGLNALQKALTAQPALVKAHLQGVIQTTSFSIAQRIRATVPVDTGAYHDAIEVTPVSGLTGGVYIRPGVIKGRRPEVYWRFVEFGTVHVPASPAIRPATQDELPEVEARVTAMATDIERDLSVGVAA